MGKRLGHCRSLASLQLLAEKDGATPLEGLDGRFGSPWSSFDGGLRRSRKLGRRTRPCPSWEVAPGMASAQSRPELTMLAWVCARRVPSASLRRAITVPGPGTGYGANQGRMTRPPVCGGPGRGRTGMSVASQWFGRNLTKRETWGVPPLWSSKTDAVLGLQRKVPFLCDLADLLRAAMS